MFDFLKKNKKIDTNEVKAFDSAVKAIEVFIAISEWWNAKKAIEEILYKETDALNKFLENYESEDISLENKKFIDKERKEYKRKEKIITNLKTNVNKLENKYIKVEEGKRFKIRFEKIKKEIDSLIWTKNPLSAMNLLQKFLEENKENSIVINFYNKEKSKIQKHIEKQRKLEEEKLKKNTKSEAMELIWETVKIEKNDDDNIDDNKSIFKKISKKLNFYKTLKERIKRKRLLDEINILIEEDSRINNEIAEKKLENIHRWLVKEINKHKIIGYDLYWKILWADKISWDTFWLEENSKKYNFFLWDATGHWIRAWFIITLINKLFKENYNNELNEIALNINNWLKQDLKSRNFVTWILFEINKENSNIWFVWMWHEPMLIYRKKENIVEKVIPGWLAAWIRLIKDINDVKIRDINLVDWDILITYSDWIIENKSIDWEYYWLEKLEKCFKIVAEYETDIKKIYDYIINDVTLFRWGSNFDDDVSMIILKRDLNKDIIKEDDKFINEIKIKEWLDKTDIKNLRWKNKEEIEKEIENIRRKKETVRIIKNLENLYYTWEILKLKEEATRFIKEWYIDAKINSYLRKAIDNEKSYRIEQKNQKMQIKYSILSELYKKWDYSTVIKEIEEIISKDWNI